MMVDGIEDKVTASAGGVQGDDGAAGESAAIAGAPPAGASPDAPAPDAGEIEWAGALVKKPPATGG